MSDSARQEPPTQLGLALGGYFFGLVLLAPLGYILAPIPVALCTLRGQTERIGFFIVVAGLAGVMGLALEQVTLVIPTMLYALMGIPLARAIQHRVPYIPLLMGLCASVLFVQLIDTYLQRDALDARRQYALSQVQSSMTGPEAEALSEQAYTQLNIQLWVLEHWNDVFLGLTFSGVLVGVSLSIGWIYRTLRRGHFEPVGSFSQFRPHDSTVWLLIVAAGMAFLNYRSPTPWLQTVSCNLALGLFTLYSLNGLAIVLHALALWKPKPWLVILGALALFMSSNVLFLTTFGLFDTWGDFRQRMNERVRAANDSQDHLE